MVRSPDEELAREVYARFGLAYYMTECVHRGLVNLFATLPFGLGEASRPRIEERARSAEQMTLGRLVNNTKELLPPALHPGLEWAVTTRNHFAHGFWFERIHQMTDNEGRERLVGELTEATDLLRELSRALDELTFGHLKKLGVTEEAIDLAFQASCCAAVEPLPTRRVPRVDEGIEIEAAWVVGDGEKSTLVLRDSLGDMWQLCDAGLGWSYHVGPGPTWRPFERLQLPATVVGRPRRAKRWHYELFVSTGAFICVEPGADGEPYAWRVTTTRD